MLKLLLALLLQQIYFIIKNKKSFFYLRTNKQNFSEKQKSVSNQKLRKSTTDSNSPTNYCQQVLMLPITVV